MTDPISQTEQPPTFEILPLSRETLTALSEMGYTHPTPVQRAVFEPASRGADLVVQARTGTGKTAAFGLPIIETVVRRQQAKVQVLILCPTRELALQVTKELERLGTPRGVRSIPIYGGAPMDRQVDALQTGAQVVVGTPGRVLDHLKRRTLDPAEIRAVVLDEADEMLSMGFERELSAILEHLPASHQTLLFSATLPPDIERIARDRLHTPEFITLSGDHVGALEVLHFVYLVAGDKIDALKKVIEVEDPESALIFCNTRAETERVAEVLQRQGFATDWLNGDLPQSDREEVMKRTREGKLRFLVATDVAARGIDISHLTHVICHDFPDSAERYVHRTGRTGRAGKTGTAISLITPKDIGNLYLLRLTYKIRPIERQLPTAGELKTRAETDIVQLLGDAFASKPTHPDDLAIARRLLTDAAAEQIVAGLIRDHLGARPDASEEAAAARRTRTHTSEPTQAKEKAQPASPPAGAAPPSPPNPSLSNWSPPSEPGDDEPIFGQPPAGPRTYGVRPRAGTRAEPAPPQRVRPNRSRPGARNLVDRQGELGGNIHVDRTTGISWAEQIDPSDLSAQPQGEAKEAKDAKDAAGEELPANPPLSIGDPTANATGHDPVEPNAPGPPPFVEVFVSVGRRDGVHSSDFERLLAETANIGAADLGGIRIRDRHSFVSIRRDQFERALRALSGASLGGKPVQAEIARARSPRTSSPNDG